jgi:transcriptional antiterminator RfaH
MRTRKRSGRFHEELEPVFPGYVFVGVREANHDGRVIGNTRGVGRLVQFGDGGPTIVPPAVISMLRSRCDEAGILLEDRSLYVGQAVSICFGGVAEFVGKIETIDSESRIWVLLDILGRSRRIQVPSASLRRL